MAVELKDDATHEDIQNYVNNVVANVEAERAGETSAERPTDAQAVASETDKPIGDMTAEDDSGSDKTAKSGKDEGEKAGKRDWLDDDLKATVAAYGIGEEEIADFTSREDLERALRFLDKSALEAGRKAMADSGHGDMKPRDGQGRFTKSEPEEKAQVDSKGELSKEADGSGYEIKLSKDKYEDDLVEEFSRMRDHYESRIAALESRFMETDARAEEQHFDNLVDSLGHADLFGKSGKESQEELDRRKDLFVAVKAQQIGLQSLGRPTDINESLVNRVARMVFAEDLRKKDLKSMTRKISKQSNGRQGGGVTRPTDSPETVREEMRRLYKELEEA